MKAALHAPTWRCLTMVALLALVAPCAEGVTLLEYWGTENVYDYTAPDAELRITIAYCLEPPVTDRLANFPHIRVQAYHDLDHPLLEEFDFLPNPNFVVVRWDAWNPNRFQDPLTGATAYVSFYDGSIRLEDPSYQPSLQFFSYTYDASAKTMAMVWSNKRPPGNNPVPDMPPTFLLLALSAVGLGISNHLTRKRSCR